MTLLLRMVLGWSVLKMGGVDVGVVGLGVFLEGGVVIVSGGVVTSAVTSDGFVIVSVEFLFASGLGV